MRNPTILLTLLGTLGCAGDEAQRDAAFSSEVYRDPAHWLCHPDDSLGTCEADLSTTVVDADGSLAIEPHVPATDPTFDCFYVYPTVSMDEAATADLVPGEEEPFVTLQQVGRLNAHCRVFAPMYRQVSVAGLFTSPETADWDGAFDDVAEAWRHYVAQSNDGRGYVLLGHSQGAGHIQRLLAEVIELDTELHEQMIGAHIMGNAVEVPDGQDAGGDLKQTPICAQPDQFGCATSWMSFRAEEPPGEDALFGMPTAGNHFACTNAAALETGGPATLHGYYPVDIPEGIGSILSGNTSPWAEPVGAPTIDTPFFSLPGLVSGSCEDANGFGYLSITVEADPTDPRADDMGGDFLPGWGLHMVDVNLVMGDLVEHVARQAAAFEAGR